MYLIFRIKAYSVIKKSKFLQALFAPMLGLVDERNTAMAKAIKAGLVDHPNANAILVIVGVLHVWGIQQELGS